MATTTATQTLRPPTEEERNALIAELLRGERIYTLAWLATLGHATPPKIEPDATFEERQKAIRESEFHTLDSLISRGYRGAARGRCTSAHDHVDRCIATEILRSLHLHDGTWRMARHKLAARLDREECTRREDSRLSNRIEAMLEAHRREQTSTLRAELRQALEAMLEGDPSKLTTVVDLADKLGMSPTSIKTMTRGIEDQHDI